MRLLAFLFAACLAVMVAFAAAVSSRQPRNIPEINASSRQESMSIQSNDDGSRMWRRAEIRVIPLEQAERNRTALESLRARVAQAERERASLWLVDSSIRQRLSSQAELMKDLLQLAEQQQSNRGKSPNALAVEHRLSQLQGQTMCEACHSGIVARNQN
jgi:parvulin-like peptidyl-prolyl isomerase